MFSGAINIVRDFADWMWLSSPSFPFSGFVTRNTHEQLIREFEILKDTHANLERTYEDLKEVHDKLVAERDNDYCTTPQKTSSTVSREILQKRFRATGKWVPSAGKSSSIPMVDTSRKGNTTQFMWDKYQNKTVLKWLQEPDASHATFQIPLGEAMSSALLLYRLHCLFPGNIYSTKQNELSPGSVWRVSLKHMKTGLTVVFTEKEGGCHIIPDIFNVGNIKPDVLFLRNELMDLIDMLFAQDFPHLKAGLVAGSYSP